MDYSGEGVSVYAEAKGEYTKYLCQYLIPSLQKYFLDLLEEAKEKEPESKKVLLKFQSFLEEFADWNMDKVQRETSAVIQGTQCQYLEELLAAVFIAHTKVLSAIRLSAKQKKLKITIPKLEHFMHRTLTECARILWSNTYLFSPSAPSIERQRNLRQIESLLHDGVLHSIRSMLPVNNILREYLHEDDDNDAAESDEEEEVKAEEKTEDNAEEKAEENAEEKADTTSHTNLIVDSKPDVENTIVHEPQFTGNDTEQIPLIMDSSGTDVFMDFEHQTNPEELFDTPPEPIDDFEDLDAPRADAIAPTKNEEETDILQMDFEEVLT